MKEGIIIDNLRKVYRVPVREHGLKHAFKSLIKMEYNEVEAVKGINLRVEPGEIVGFIGPNGAGKTTTLKMLSGILYPTSGDISVYGFKPWERQHKFLRNISMVMGNKSTLTWDITVEDSFFVMKEIYGVSDADFKQRLNELKELLDIGHLLKNQARNLSLGERSKCELTAALLHQPRVLFLDEPTLGLDVSMQLRLRSFIKEYNQKHETTILLTSHYMEDISSLCKRVVLINQGKLLYDGSLEQLSGKIAPYRILKVSFMDEDVTGTIEELKEKFTDSLQVMELAESYVLFKIQKEAVPEIVSEIFNSYCIGNVTINDAPIDSVIDEVYREGRLL
ncbi:ABC transporter ATP-binding protein [Paenibacillus odorifer]|uniref:ABC transporter ATP-binding protein n=1 Tax=Paenibacillus odorifer TaxID=189426 RepID=UPI00097008F1|nr:ATP-binding cassette domain-containing protein [Paenibacillus odorifer]OMD87410.1 hypothetical protein BSK67_27530 [Paenibacillus odorifer]